MGERLCLRVRGCWRLARELYELRQAAEAAEAKATDRRLLPADVGLREVRGCCIHRPVHDPSTAELIPCCILQMSRRIYSSYILLYLIVFQNFLAGLFYVSGRGPGDPGSGRRRTGGARLLLGPLGLHAGPRLATPPDLQNEGIVGERGEMNGRNKVRPGLSPMARRS